MRPIVRRILVLGAAVTPAATLGAQQMQTVRVEVRSQRADSLVTSVMQSDVPTVKRMLTNWRERDAQLHREFRALDESDVNAQRRVQEQMRLHASDLFAMMSAVQARCMQVRSPRAAGYLGLNLDMLGEISDDGSPPKPRGNFVASVEPGSPAQRAGILAKDRVVSIAGLDALTSTPEIGAMLIPGRTMVVRIERDGQQRDLTLTVAPRPAGFGEGCDELERELGPMRIAGAGQVMMQEPSTGMIRRFWVGTREPVEAPAPSEEITIELFSPSGTPRVQTFFGGAVFRALDADWGEALGVRQGVIVGDVATGSPASLSGLKGGDVITAVGSAPVSSPVVLVRILNSIPAKQAELTVVRAREKKSLTLTWSAR